MTEPKNDIPADVAKIGTTTPSNEMVSPNGAQAEPIETTVPHENSLVSQKSDLGERAIESSLSMNAKGIEPSDGSDSQQTDNYMVIGLFDSPDSLMHAIASLKAKGIRNLEAYTPYPIHGIDDALGLKRSPLGAMVMVMGIIGALTALGFQFWISAIDYPIVTGGKPPWSWEAFVPIMFEVTVLFATFTAGLGMLFLLNRLPFFGHPVINSKSMARITRDQYALAIERDEAAGAPLDTIAAKDAFQAVGALSIETVPSPAKAPIFTSEFILRSLGAIVSACLVTALLMYWTIKLFPELPPMSHMLEQPKLLPQQSSKFFRDGHGMRLPPKGTVARGYLGLGSVSQNDAASLVNTLPRNLEFLEIGKRKFTERCAVCHGALANGVGSLTAAYGGKPANLQSEQFKKYTDGQIYWVIVNGKNAMPSHAADLSPDQRWAVVHYVRALQRAQDAKDSDLNP
jgi:cytochrome c5